MKRKLGLTLLTCIAVGACACLCACIVPKGNKNKLEAPVEIVLGDVTATSITVIDCSYGDEYGHESEVCIDGGEWIYCDGSEPVCFNGLQPLTEYTVSARQKAGDGGEPSDSVSRKVKTLRGQTSRVPENIAYEQANGTVTLKGVTGEMEVSYDGGLTYTDSASHTFTDKGVKQIKIRFKETQTETAGEPLTVKFLYSDFYGGSGEAEDPFLVESYEQLVKIEGNGGKCFKLIKDITYPTEAVTEPIRFGGTLDGNGKKIISPKIDFTQNNTMWGYGSIFATNSAVSVRNLTVENADIKTHPSRMSQSILVNNANELTDCHVSGKITVNCKTAYAYRVGALCSALEDGGKISGCSADLAVETAGTDFSGLIVGGLAATFEGGGVIEKSQAKLVVKNTLHKYMHIGGLVGEITEKSATISESKADLDIDVATGMSSYICGVAGYVQVKTDITDCLSTGKIKVDGGGTLCVVSGIATGTGKGNVGSVTNCLSNVKMDLDGTDTDMFVGGILCYATGSSSANERVENCLFAGEMNLTVGAGKHCYANGTVWGANFFDETNNYFAAQASKYVSEGEAAVLENGEYLNADWQKNTLKLDESVWSFKDGELPNLKALS